MARLPLHTESSIRGASSDSSRLSRSGNLIWGMPRVLLYILVGIAVGAAVTIATMSMTSISSSRASSAQKAAAGRGSQELQPRSSKVFVVPRLAHEV